MAHKEKKGESQQSILLKSLFSGAFGSFFWGIISSIGYYFSFSEVSHASFIIRSFFSGPWTDGIWAETISLFILTIIGVIPALIYYLLFKKLKGITPGILYGVSLWLIVLVFLNPLFYYVPPVAEMNSDTIVTTICQFILYGVFVGYTISYESHERRITPKSSQNEI